MSSLVVRKLGLRLRGLVEGPIRVKGMSSLVVRKLGLRWF